jgi:hypothetical protein
MVGRVTIISALVVVLALPVTLAAAAEIEVSELIAAIKQGIEGLQRAAKPPLIKIPWIEAEVSYVVKTEGGGGVRAYVVTAEGKYATEAVQRTKYRLEFVSIPRVETPGEIKNAKIEGYDPTRKVIFVSDPQSFGWAPWTVPMSVAGKPVVLDAEGRPLTFKSWADFKGKSLNVFYKPGPTQGSLQASQVVVTER